MGKSSSRLCCFPKPLVEQSRVFSPSFVLFLFVVGRKVICKAQEVEASIREGESNTE